MRLTHNADGLPSTKNQWVPVNRRMQPDDDNAVMLFFMAVPNLSSETAVAFIWPDGSASFTPTGSCLQPLLDCWNDDALTTADRIGQARSRCFWCNRPLTQETSHAKGSGKTCRDRYGEGMAACVARAAGAVRSLDIAPPPAPARTVRAELLGGGEMEVPARVVLASPVLREAEASTGSQPRTRHIPCTPGTLKSLDEHLRRAEYTDMFPVRMPPAAACGGVPQLTVRPPTRAGARGRPGGGQGHGLSGHSIRRPVRAGGHGRQRALPVPQCPRGRRP